MKHFLLQTWLVLVCLLIGAGTMWGETADYTLTPSAGSNSSYTGNCDVTVGDITWNITGNASMTPWRIGGKSISSVERTVYSKTAYTSAVKKVDLTVGAASSITVNSLKLVYSTNSDFSNASEISNTFAANSTISFEGNFPANAYYKFVFNVTVSGSSNKFVEFSKVEFYNANGSNLEPTPYTVSFNAGSNGICATTFLTEESAGTGVTLPSCTANSNYTFEGWSTSSTPTSANAGVAGATYKPSADCTLYAYYTYQAPSHDAKFFVNGLQYGDTQSVAEGSAITFPAENPSIDGVVFIGWAENEIAGTQDNAPTLVTSKNMGDADANFYAVFATANTGGASGSYTLDYATETDLSSSTAWGTYGKAYEYTASDGSKWVVKGYKNKGIQLNTGKDASIKVPVCPSSISSVVVTGANVTYYFSESDYTGNNGTSIANAQGTTATIDLSAKNVTTGYIYTSASSAVTKIVVNYGEGTTYSDYCTTVSAKATATLNIADEDTNVALGYNGTKNVAISVKEAEYDGTLSVTSTNEDVATVTYTGTTATINYVGEGEAYISVTAPSTTNYYAINAPQAIKVTTTDDRSVAEVTINPETISVDNGSSADYSVTTAYNGTISVASDKPGVATVSYSEGKVTVEGKSVGTATLTISGEGNANYKPFSKEFTITVNKVVPVGIKNLHTLLSSTTATNYEVKLEDAIVTAVGQSGTSTPTIYVEDAEAGVVIYVKNTNLEVGDVLNGEITGKGNNYNGQTQLTTIDLTKVTKTKTTDIPCHEITLSQLAEDGMEAWESRRVIVKDLDIVKTMGETATRTATVSQGNVSFNVYEKIGSGCSGDKLSSTDSHIVSITGYFVDNTYGGSTTTQLNITSADDIILSEKADAQVVFNLEAGTGTNESPVAFTIGEDNTFPTAVVKDSEGNEIAGATVTYSTGNDAFISVDAETGVVSLKKYASKSNNVHVTATFAGNADYKSATADYYLTISKGQPVISFAEPTVEVALDGTANLAAIVDAKYGSLAVTYTSSNPEVASFANENNPTLTLNAEGATTISAKTVTNDAWNQSESVSYTLTVTAPVAGYAYVTLDACGNDVEGYTEPLKVVKGRTVTLPAATTIKNDYTFRGWTSKEVTKTTTAPALVANNYVVDADVTLYPVFSMEESDGNDNYDVAWVAVESSEIQTSGYDVVIVSTGTKSRCIKTTAGKDYLVGADVTIEEGKITSTITDDSKWWAYESGSGVAFASFAGNYLNPSTVSYNQGVWTITPNGDKTYSMKSKNSDTYLYLNGNAWATTSDASLSKMQFFMEKLIPTGSTTTYYVSRTMNVLELDENAESVEEINDEYDKVIVHRTIKAGNWNTLCLPFAMNPTQIAENFGSDAEVKVLADLTVNGDSYTMHFEDCDEIDAALPCMIRLSNPVTSITVEGNVEVDTTEDPEDFAENGDNLVTFVGNYAKTLVPEDKGNYIISSNKFYFVNSAVTNKGFRGYFNLFSLNEENLSNKKISFDFNGTLTGIENVNIEGLDDKIFDLQGRRVQRLQKGVNIVNGRKVIR